jgi:hypothetical protein
MDEYKYLLGVHDMPTVPLDVRVTPRAIIPFNSLKRSPYLPTSPVTHITLWEYRNIQIAHAAGHPAHAFRSN